MPLPSHACSGSSTTRAPSSRHRVQSPLEPDARVQDALRRVADPRPEDVEQVSRAAHRRVAHLGAEQHRTGLEAGQTVARAAQLSRHHQCVVPPRVPEHPEVRVAEDLRPGLEGNAVGGHRDPGALLAVLAHAVEVHADLAAFVVDVHVGRRDVGLEVVLLDAGTRDIPADPLAHGFGDGPFGREVRCLQRERPRHVHAPRAGERVGEGQPDVRPLVVREVQVVATEGLLDPVRDPDERRAVDVGAHPSVHVGPDDRLGGESHRADVVHAADPVRRVPEALAGTRPGDRRRDRRAPPPRGYADRWRSSGTASRAGGPGANAGRSSGSRRRSTTSSGSRSRCPCRRARAAGRARARLRSAPPADPGGRGPSGRWRCRRACT